MGHGIVDKAKKDIQDRQSKTNPETGELFLRYRNDEGLSPAQLKEKQRLLQVDSDAAAEAKLKQKAHDLIGEQAGDFGISPACFSKIPGTGQKSGTRIVRSKTLT